MTESPSKLKRYALFPILLVGIAGLLFSGFAEHNANASTTRTSAQPVAIKFHAKIVWVSQKTAHDYHLGLKFFLGAWVLGMLLVLGEKAHELD